MTAGQVFMATNESGRFTRRALLGAFAATAITAAPHYAGAAGFLRGAGDIRRIKLYNARTSELADIIYWVEGDYIGDALAEVNHVMRDWRTGEVKQIDRRAIDIMAAAHNLMDATEAYTLMSGYRSPATNAMLRGQSSGVARNSRHMRGQAADLRLRTRSVSDMARAAMACRAGGVGRYTGANFVHMDSGPVRSWGR